MLTKTIVSFSSLIINKERNQEIPMKVYDIISEAVPLNIPTPIQFPDGRWGFNIGGNLTGAFRSKNAAIEWAKNNPDKLRPVPVNPVDSTKPNPMDQMRRELEKGDGKSSTGGQTRNTPTGQTHTASPDNPNQPKKASGGSLPPDDGVPGDKGGEKAGTTDGKQRRQPTRRLRGRYLFRRGQGMVNIDRNGKERKVRPIDAVDEVVEGGKAKVKTATENTVTKGLKKATVRLAWVLGLGLAVTEWIDDMHAVQTMFDAGQLGDDQENARDTAQDLRAYYSTIAFNKGLTMLAAMGGLAALAAQLRAFIPLFAGIPGFGWMAGGAMFIATMAIPYMLSQEEIQAWLLKNVMQDLYEDYPVGELIGKLGGATTAFFSGATGGGRDPVTRFLPAPMALKELNSQIKTSVKLAITDGKVTDPLELQRLSTQLYSQGQTRSKIGRTDGAGNPGPTKAAAAGVDPENPLNKGSGGSNSDSVSADDLIKQLYSK